MTRSFFGFSKDIGRLRAPILSIVLLFLSGWVAAQTHEATAATELRERPALDARVLTPIPRGEKLTRTATQGGWLKVKVRDQEGWVRLTTVKALPTSTTAATPSAPRPPAASTATSRAAPPATAAAAAPSTSPNLASLFTGSSTRPTATTGTRGLTQEQLANAQPAPAEVELLERYSASTTQAQEHARAGRLAAQTFEPYTGAP